MNIYYENWVRLTPHRRGAISETTLSELRLLRLFWWRRHNIFQKRLSLQNFHRKLIFFFCRNLNVPNTHLYNFILIFKWKALLWDYTSSVQFYFLTKNKKTAIVLFGTFMQGHSQEKYFWRGFCRLKTLFLLTYIKFVYYEFNRGKWYKVIFYFEFK